MGIVAIKMHVLSLPFGLMALLATFLFERATQGVTRGLSPLFCGLKFKKFGNH